MMLRAVPDLTDYRPADANETAACWRLALERSGPCFFALTRQDLPVIDPATHDAYANVSKGAYVLQDAPNPKVILIGTGSEVWPCVDGAKLLAAEGIAARVVSFPSWEIFDEQSAEYKASVLLPGVPKLAVEAGSPLGWWKYVGLDGDVIGLDRFGASAPGPMVLSGTGIHGRECCSAGQGAFEEIAGLAAHRGIDVERRFTRTPLSPLTEPTPPAHLKGMQYEVSYQLRPRRLSSQGRGAGVSHQGRPRDDRSGRVPGRSPGRLSRFCRAGG